MVIKNKLVLNVYKSCQNIFDKLHGSSALSLVSSILCIYIYIELTFAATSVSNLWFLFSHSGFTAQGISDRRANPTDDVPTSPHPRAVATQQSAWLVSMYRVRRWRPSPGWWHEYGAMVTPYMMPRCDVITVSLGGGGRCVGSQDEDFICMIMTQSWFPMGRLTT